MGTSKSKSKKPRAKSKLHLVGSREKRALLGSRTEHDSMGEIQVPASSLWGAQTQRALEHFQIGSRHFSPEFIHAYALIKLAAARANARVAKLSLIRAAAIERASQEVVDGYWDGQFPLSIFQTGSGTQLNMNLNEVIAHRASEICGQTVHPNDDVNRSQSTNDTFPTAMHMATVFELHERLRPALFELIGRLERKAMAYTRVTKMGRTHLQDAVPMSFGQEISGWVAQLGKGWERIENCIPQLLEVPLGGSAVGTGVNVPPRFAELALSEIRKRSGYDFRQSDNRYEAQAAHDAMAAVSSSLRVLAGSLLKISNDIRWLASGPRAGLNEIVIPANEPGSSIMPGKVNPTQAEALSQVVVQVYGNDSAVAFAASQGHFELNTYKPVILHNVLNSIRLLSDACVSFEKFCIRGLTPNIKRMKHNADSSLMLATRLTPHLGYDRVARIVQEAQENDLTVREAALRLGATDAIHFDRWIKEEPPIARERRFDRV